MLRHPALIPLSRQHHATLAICTRLNRAGRLAPLDVEYWQQQFWGHYQQELRKHFEIEEQVLYAAARMHPATTALAQELSSERQVLSELLMRAGQQALERKEITSLAESLSALIRREEREFFEKCQQVCSPEEMQQIGVRITSLLADTDAASRSCEVRPK